VAVAPDDGSADAPLTCRPEVDQIDDGSGHHQADHGRKRPAVSLYASRRNQVLQQPPPELVWFVPEVGPVMICGVPVDAIDPQPVRCPVCGLGLPEDANGAEPPFGVLGLVGPVDVPPDPPDGLAPRLGVVAEPGLVGPVGVPPEPPAELLPIPELGLVPGDGEPAPVEGAAPVPPAEPAAPPAAPPAPPPPAPPPPPPPPPP